MNAAQNRRCRPGQGERAHAVTCPRPNRVQRFPSLSSAPPGARRQNAGCSPTAFSLLRLRSLSELSQTALYDSYGAESGERRGSPPTTHLASLAPVSSRPPTPTSLPSLAYKHHLLINASVFSNSLYRILILTVSPPPPSRTVVGHPMHSASVRTVGAQDAADYVTPCSRLTEALSQTALAIASASLDSGSGGHPSPQVRRRGARKPSIAASVLTRSPSLRGGIQPSRPSPSSRQARTRRLRRRRTAPHYLLVGHAYAGHILVDGDARGLASRRRHGCRAPRVRRRRQWRPAPRRDGWGERWRRQGTAL
jgi:hypothetical protein